MSEFLTAAELRELTGYRAAGRQDALLSTPDGFPVTSRMLRTSYDRAREKAASRPENRMIAQALRAMFLRDMRKRAADLTETDDAAAELLQHSSKAVTRKHYVSRATNLKPVR